MPVDEQEIKTMKAEIDSLQIQVARAHSPWYANAPVWIAGLALLFSFGTTGVSWYNSHFQELREARKDLRELLQRLTAIPTEHFEFGIEHADDTLALGTFSSLVQQESVLLATQAYAIIERFPTAFNSSEYGAVALALMASAITENVPWLLDKAIATSNNINDRVTAIRQWGAFLINTGDVDEGRRTYVRALDVWSELQDATVTSFYKDSTDVLTYMYWAQQELGQSNKREAIEAIEKAEGVLNELAPGPVSDFYRRQVEDTRRRIMTAPSR